MENFDWVKIWIIANYMINAVVVNVIQLEWKAAGFWQYFAHFPFNVEDWWSGPEG